MGISPIHQGEVLAWTLSWILDDNAGPLDLTAATSLALIFNPAHGSPSGNTRFVGTGTITVMNALAGQVRYVNSASDTALPGLWLITGVANFVVGPRYTDELELLIRPAP